MQRSAPIPIRSALIRIVTVFIRGYELKKESKMALKKVDFGHFLAAKKVDLKSSKYVFERKLNEIRVSERLCESTTKASCGQHLPMGKFLGNVKFK